MQPEETTKIDDWVFHPTLADGSKETQARPQADPPSVDDDDDASASASASRRAPEPMPQQLGRFKVTGRLGRGGMGTVLEAYDETLDRRVAVKLLHEHAGTSHRRRLVREAQALARLSHPHVVQVYDAGEQDGRLFIAMELVPGQTLWEWQQVPRPWPEILQVYMEAARGLAAAHAEGIIHRDFKPTNCIIDHEGHAKVLDFGLARGVDDVDDPELEGRVATLDPQAGRATGKHVIEPAPGSTKGDSELDEDDGNAGGRAAPRVVPSPEASSAGSSGSSSARGPAMVEVTTSRLVGRGRSRRTDASGSSASSSALSQRLTQTGALLGTPAYMAPEQAAGQPSDARGDQFSLCVALYEALYAQRPYAGNPAMALLSDPPPTLQPPAGRPGLPRVPGWLRRVLLRGLSARKDDRFESIDALLEALERGRKRRRAMGLAAVAVGLLLGGAALASGGASPCEGLRDAEMPGFSDAERSKVREALLAVAGEGGEATWSATERGLDEYARQWSDAKAQACEATHVDRVATPALLERRMECLDERAAGVRATVALLSEADDHVAAHAPQAVRSLPAIEPCLHAPTVRSRPALPESLAEPAAAVREALARSWAFDATGRADRGLTAAEEAVTQAAALGEQAASLHAEALHNRGRLYRAVGRLADARRDLQAVLEQAERTDDEGQAIDALRELVGVALDEADRSASAAWMTVVQGKLARAASERPLHEAQLRMLQGQVALQQGDHEAAVQSLTAAVRAFEAMGDAAMLERGQARLQLAVAHGWLGHDEAATQGFDEALALARREGLMPLEAWVQHERGRYFDRRGQADAAETALQAALQLRIVFDGPHAPVTIPTRTLLANLLAQRGELDEALAMADGARQSLGPSVSANRRAQVMTLLASLERARGDWEAALDHYRQAYDAWSGSSTPDEVELAMLDTTMADCLMMMGRHSAARERYEAAIQVLKIRVRDDDGRHVYPLFGLAHLLYEQGEVAGAIALYRRAWAIQQGVADNPELSAVLGWELARAVLGDSLTADDEREQARSLVNASREHYREVGDTARVAEIDAFLATCGPPCGSTMAQPPAGAP